MKKLLPSLRILKSAKGFTLIELLVVIGILGILAASLVATIDPFEQLKKANDANVKNALVEYLDANVRYYTTHNAYPWDTNGADCNGGVAPDGLTQSLTDTDMIDCTTALTSENELKSGFGTATNLLQEIYITYNSTDNAIVGCFQPQSKSQQAAVAADPKDANGDAHSGAVTCGFTSGVPTTTSGGCFWCTQ